MKYNLMIGLNDKDKLIQIIDTESAKKMVVNTLNNYGINALTLYEVNGIFTNENNITTTEKSLKVEIINDTIDYNTIKEIINILKKSLNQECIGLEIQKIEVEWL